MSSKIYEYKDTQDWYVGEWSSRGETFHFKDVDSEELSRMEEELRQLVVEEQSFSVAVIQYNSMMSFVQFVLQMINENQDSQFQAQFHKGAILITEKGQLVLVHLPKNGIQLNDFFSQKDLSGLTVGDTILVATRNEGKTAEFRKIFEKLGYKIENLNDYPDLPEVAETGMTFEENARLKAETISKLTGKMVLADDSGLKVDALGGLPGVWSARFAGNDATDLENNAKLLHELAMVFDLKDRSAQFHTTLVVASPDKESLVVEADWPGYINFEPKCENGFGYDPLFLVGETGKTSAELTMEEKNAQSHRAQAVQKLVEVFPTWQNKPSS